MVETCNVTGQVVLPTGETPGRLRVLFVPAPAEIAPSANRTVEPRPVSTQTDSAGNLSVDLVPGAYTAQVVPPGNYTYPPFRLTVPDTPTANLAQIQDLPPPPTLDAAQQAVLAAQGARDDANEHAATAQGWAESATEPGGVGTKSAKTWASEAGANAATAQAAETDAITARDAALGFAATAEASATDAQAAETGAATARDDAQGWAESATEPGGAGTKSAKTWASEAGANAATAQAAETAAGASATDAALSADQAATLAAGVELRGAVATLSAVLGQVARDGPALRDSVEQGLADVDALRGLAATALAWAGQISAQVNGGRVELAGGTLADPALRIGTVGVYSSAADTLSIAIAGAERLRVTPAGITVYGTITEA